MWSLGLLFGTECKAKYGRDIDELNLRKALLAREINECKVSLERINFELQKMKTLYEHAKSELNDVNETMKQQELQRDAYLTQFDEKWTFTDSIRKRFHKQSELNNKIKGDAKEWTRKLEELQKYHKSEENMNKLFDDIWKFGR